MSGNDKFDGTKIDLGEDLLEATRVLERPATKKSQAVETIAPNAEQSTPEDLVQRGQILMDERLFEDAKKVFRKVLRLDPANSQALQLLDDIQKLEIQELLAGEASRRKLGQEKADSDDEPKEVLARLERELHLNLEKNELRPIPDLFKDPESQTAYRESIEAMLGSLSPRDRIDIGVAHLEMGLFDVAQSVFESMVRHDTHKISAMYLLGIALIYGGKAIEATIRLEPLARDLTLSESQKVDFLYLMGLAFEKLSDEKKARDFYRRVSTLNPKYRDVPEKLR